ncbi:MAG: Wzz/FepE/Etk N-terminal domain-containing protein, partial [Bryobacterales bacterium]|nr:Wzz/FepE/Etk N-terminal domain-containing protein [Bryobacterales bacterium]
MAEIGPGSRREIGPVARTEGPSQAYQVAPEGFEEGGPGGLVEYWRILRRRKGTLILIAFLGGLLGLLITLPQTPIYQARVSLEIQDLNQNFMNMKDISPVSEAGGSLNALSDIQTQIRILQSESLIESAMGKLKMAKPEEAVADPTRVAAWRKALNLAAPEEPETMESRVKKFARNLKVRAAGQTRIIEVLFDSTDPKLAAEFANGLANEFIDSNVEARWKMTQRTGEWLTRQIDEIRIKL